jgi:peroxiredoxin Q/BCP
MKPGAIREGSLAPEFRLQDQDGHWVRLSELLAGGPVLLAFYHEDFTPACTRQLCSYQSHLDQFRGLGVRVVGISSDPVDRHRKFRADHGLEFTLLTDPGREAAKAYGVNTLGLLRGIGRGLFLVGRDGTVLYRQMELSPFTHQPVEALLPALRRLREEKRID